MPPQAPRTRAAFAGAAGGVRKPSTKPSTGRTRLVGRSFSDPHEGGTCPATDPPTSLGHHAHAAERLGALYKTYPSGGRRTWTASFWPPRRRDPRSTLTLTPSRRCRKKRRPWLPVWCSPASRARVASREITVRGGTPRSSSRGSPLSRSSSRRNQRSPSRGCDRQRPRHRPRHRDAAAASADRHRLWPR